MNNTKFRVHESKEDIKEILTRYTYFIPGNDKIKQACLKEFNNSLRPDYIILLKTECLYKTLMKPLKSMPSEEKQAIGSKIRECILNIRSHISQSANINSLALQEAKKASCELSALKGHIDLMCGLDFFSTPFHTSICNYLADIEMALQMWFRVLK